MGIKRDKYDTTVSELVRECADYTCQRCGRYGRGEGAYRMDCAHIFGRRNQATRYDLDNCLCLCFVCHRTVDEDYQEQEILARKILGDTRLEALIQKKNSIKKWMKGEKDEMRDHYKVELAKIKERRNNGETGVLSAVNWF